MVSDMENNISHPRPAFRRVAGVVLSLVAVVVAVDLAVSGWRGVSSGERPAATGGIAVTSLDGSAPVPVRGVPGSSTSQIFVVRAASNVVWGYRPVVADVIGDADALAKCVITVAVVGDGGAPVTVSSPIRAGALLPARVLPPGGSDRVTVTVTVPSSTGSGRSGAAPGWSLSFAGQQNL